MKRLLFALLVLVFITGCRKNCIDGSECLQTKIEQFRLNVICPEGASIKEYTFQDNTVYVFDQTGCMADGWANVWDKNCNLLGMLGGMAGFSKINGVAFYDNATYVQTVWEN